MLSRRSFFRVAGAAIAALAVAPLASITAYGAEASRTVYWVGKFEAAAVNRRWDRSTLLHVIQTVGAP